MESPLVSVVVVSYNQAQYITQMLDSLKSQTYTNWELIVADDQSQDESVQVFKDWLATNKVQAKEIYHKVNTGLATVLNEAIELCEGKYVKLIAADDYLHPECLQVSVAKFQTLPNDCGLIFTDYIAVDEKGKITEFFLDYTKGNYVDNEGFLLQDQLIKYNCIVAPSTLIKKSALIKTGKYKEDFILEDHHRWLMINETMKIYFVNQKLIYYRITESGITGTRKERMVEEDLYLRMKYDKKGFNRHVLNRAISDKYVKSEVISPLLIKEYNKYPFNIKRLTWAIKLNIPPYLYSFINRFT